MPRFLLHIEAINLDHFVYDSEDLATIRGGGLLLLFLHEFLTGSELIADGDPQNESKLFQAKTPSNDQWTLQQLPELTIQLVSKGASILLYQLDVPDNSNSTDYNIDRITDSIRNWFRQHRFLQHTTIAIACVPLSDAEPRISDPSAHQTIQRARSEVRRRQQRYASLNYGPINDDPKALYCDIDRLRAGVCDLNESETTTSRSALAKATDKNWASPSARARRAFGRDTKRRVYGMVAEDVNSFSHFVPTWHLEELTRRGKDRLDRLEEPDPLCHLAGKMMVMYADGNQFGRVVETFCNTLERRRAIDQKLRSLQKNLMVSLVEKMGKQINTQWRVKASDFAISEYGVEEQARIETLLWGGDELIWVVPAWCGVEVIEHFQSKTANWQVVDSSSDISRGSTVTQLTHAVGAVFCSHKSPIRAVVQLAKELAESCKQSLSASDIYSPGGNRVAYQILESFDTLGSDFERGRAAGLPKGMSPSELVLTSENWNWLTKRVLELKRISFPTKRLHELSNMMTSVDSPISMTDGKLNEDCSYWKLSKRIVDTMETDPVRRQELLQNYFTTPPPWNEVGYASLWYHIRELWDYVIEDETKSLPPGGFA